MNSPRLHSHNNSELEELWSSKEGLVRCSANHVPLSPIGFLERAAKAYRDRTSVIYGSLKYTWAQTHQRCLKLASALTRLGISRGDVLSGCNFGTNVPTMHELHFAAPMAGAVLCTLNARLDSAMISVLLCHSEAKIVFVDHQLLGIVDGALELITEKAVSKPPIVVLIADSDGSSSPNSSTSETEPPYEYESLLESGNSGFEIRRPKSEWDPISVNYTSGTTSRPKGVVYNHRGAYLNSLATVLLCRIGSMPVNLWTAPMFHCHGWSLIWGLAAQGGTKYSSWKPEWDSLPSDERSKLKARQGVQHVALEEVDIKDSVTMESVPLDGKTMGGIMFRGNTVMSG
ncbi:putative 4-coumarate--CoA ligase [Rosa chinensis]|uniref:Putative 4-coumarate--CoA ligase n=1 Tax=Rosa chinensis TaxID=74649 RepID=A0A2P6RLE8_ROSCH|nr:putative 4-coumarate--CoA ligase [Rosa chinensis]